MANNKYTKDFLEPIVKKSACISDLLRNLGLKNGGNFSHIKAVLNKLNINTSHFTSRNKLNTIKKEKHLPQQYLIKGILRQPYKIKMWLLRDKIKEYKCDRCGNTEWLNNPIPLECHVINGDHTDYRLENIQLLCPNCHVFTDNYKIKNSKIIINKTIYKCKKCNVILKQKRKTGLCISCRAKNLFKFNKPKKEKQKYYCNKCKVGLKTKTKTGRCKKCNYIARRKVERPNLEELKLKLKELGMKSVSKELGVHRRTISGWYKKIGDSWR